MKCLEKNKNKIAFLPITQTSKFNAFTHNDPKKKKS